MGVLWFVLMGCVSPLITVLFFIGMYQTLKKRVDAAGGLEAIKQKIQQGDETRLAHAYPTVQPAGETGATLGCGLSVLLTGLLALGIGVTLQTRAIREAILLKNEGVHTMAVVTAKEISEDDEGSDTYYISYAFVAPSPMAPSETGEQQQVERRESVSRQLYEHTKQEGQIAVIYARRDPHIARIVAQYRPGKVTFWPILIGGAVGVSLLLVTPWMYQRYRDARRLEAEGIRTTVTILDVYEQFDSDSFSYYVAYALPGGQPIRHIVSHRVFQQLQTSRMVRVLYLPDDPQIFRPEWD